MIADEMADAMPEERVDYRSLKTDVPAGGWWAVTAAFLGWTFEVYDLAIMSLLMPVLLDVFHLTKAQAGTFSGVSAFGAILGGIVFGHVADRIGRVRTLFIAVLIYSIFSGLVILTQTLPQILVLRFVGGLGMGGAWSAGAALVAETWPPRHRGKAGAMMQAGLPMGSFLAIGLCALVAHFSGNLAGGAWKWLFVIGVLPAVILYPITRKTPESPIWLAGQASRRTAEGQDRQFMSRAFVIAFLFIFFLQFAFWGVSTWTPTFLVTVKHMSFVKSMGFVLGQQLGTLAGFVVLASIIDRIGRRPTFILYLLIGAGALPLFILSRDPATIWIATLLLGFGIGGVFAGLGPFLAEVMARSPARALGMAIAYNGGRAGALIAPVVIGLLGTSEAGFQRGMGLVGLGLAAAIVTVLLAPETKGAQLQ